MTTWTTSSAAIATTIDQCDDPVRRPHGPVARFTSSGRPRTPELYRYGTAANLKLRSTQAKEDVLAPACAAGRRAGAAAWASRRRRGARPGEASGRRRRRRCRRRPARLCAVRATKLRSRWQDAKPSCGSRRLQRTPKQAGESGSYNLGLCAWRQDQNADATGYWEKCVQAGRRRGAGRRPGVWPRCASTDRTRRPPWKCSRGSWTASSRATTGRVQLTDRASAVKLFQEAGKAYLDNHQYRQAVRLADSFASAAAPWRSGHSSGPGVGGVGAGPPRGGQAQAAGDARRAAEENRRGKLFLQAAAAYASAAAAAHGRPGAR